MLSSKKTEAFIRVYRLEIANFYRHSVMLLLSTQFCDLYSPLLPLSPSLCFNSPPPPSLCKYRKYTVYTCAKGGWCWAVLETIFCRILPLWQDSEPKKLLYHPKQKSRKWGGLHACRKVPLQVNFLDDEILHCLLWVLSFCLAKMLR